MRVRFPRWILVAVCAGCCHPAMAEEALLHDPFIKPSLAGLATNGAAAAGAAEEMPGSPKLTAVMLAGASSLVTVDGVVMKLGDEREGYRLVKIRDHKAVFKKGKQRVVLKMDAPH